MWRVFVVLIVLGLLSGCEGPNVERVSPLEDVVLRLPGGDYASLICLDGHVFVVVDGYETVAFVQFWETGADGQPRPKVCGGGYAE